MATCTMSTLRPFAASPAPGRPGLRRKPTCCRATAAPEKVKVVVTGAGGRTGALVVKKLLQAGDKFEVRATVRSIQSAGKLRELGLPEAALLEADIASGPASGQLASALAGTDALVIATSAVPKIKFLSLIPVLLAKLFRQDGVRPEFSWKENQTPEKVDWEGQRLQIDAAKSAGVKKVVLVSSMGGCDPDNSLNKIGNGQILQWKRRAEQYLVASGLNYTIIHPGGLIDDKGGERELVVDVDDRLLKREYRSIPREDVASLCVTCLTSSAADYRSFDVCSNKPGEGAPTVDNEKLLTDMTANCNYEINSQMAVSAA